MATQPERQAAGLCEFLINRVMATADRRQPLLYLMLSCGAWLLRGTYELVYHLKFVNMNDIRSNPDEPAYLELIELGFHSWSIFVVIILLFAAGAKKKGGIWSTHQSWMNSDEGDSSEGIPLGSMDASPPAYSAESSPVVAPPPAVVGGSPRTGPGSGQAPQGQWQQSTVAARNGLEDGDQGLVAGLGPPQRYQPPRTMDNAYNTGIVPPLSPDEAGPADGYDMGMHAEVSDGYMGMNAGPADGYGAGPRLPPQSPPGHDEAMGLNHQADGRAPPEALPYPQKN